MDIIRISSLVYLLFRVTGLILCICLIRNLSVAFLPRRFRKKKTQEQENLLGNDDYQTKNLLLYFFICIILNVIGFCAMIIWPIVASLHSKTIILQIRVGCIIDLVINCIYLGLYPHLAYQIHKIECYQKSLFYQ